ncbi:hypothetical protein CPC08DRAFT_782165 [Agrocybe pediades]|nr:hypothetical protein CPC08DRAFT_782165 [Agrocybe pediades]
MALDTTTPRLSMYFLGGLPDDISRELEVNVPPRPFDLEVFVSGYVISYRPPENASRSQRAFMRLAKGFASLPKLVDSVGDVRQNSSSLAHLTPSTEALLAQVKLPPRPEEIADDYDVEELDRRLQRAKLDDMTTEDTDSISSSNSSNSDLPSSNTVIQLSAAQDGFLGADVISRLHRNLEQRLQPFWSSVLPNRTVRLHIFNAPQSNTPSPGEKANVLGDSRDGPLISQDVVTGPDGSFQVKFNIGWEELCHHPQALHIAFGDAVEHDLLIVAQLLPQSGVSPTTPTFQTNASTESMSIPLTSLTRIPITHSPIRVISDIDDTIKFSGILSGARAVFHNVFVKELSDNIIPGMGEWYASMWSRGVRFHYISNGPFELLPVLNEFFEVSQLPRGSIKLKSYAGRSLFNGLLSAPAARKRAGVVDVLDSFPDCKFFLIGDTGEQDLELYADLARERPDRVLAVFVRDADALTPGGPPPLEDPTGWKAMGAAGTRPPEKPLVSRSDTGMTTASTSSTPSYSKYNFSGSSGPINLSTPTPDNDRTPRPAASAVNSGYYKGQTYLDVGLLSAEPESLKPFGDAPVTPTVGSSAQLRGDNYQPSYINQPPQPTLPPSVVAGLTPRQSSTSASFRSQNTTSSAPSTKKVSMTDTEKRRYELQLRVYRARTQMPSHIPLRVFREPGECVEAQEILDRESD